jgi:hypothetical protein
MIKAPMSLYSPSLTPVAALRHGNITVAGSKTPSVVGSAATSSSNMDQKLPPQGPGKGTASQTAGFQLVSREAGKSPSRKSIDDAHQSIDAAFAPASDRQWRTAFRKWLPLQQKQMHGQAQAATAASQEAPILLHSAAADEPCLTRTEASDVIQIIHGELRAAEDAHEIQAALHAAMLRTQDLLQHDEGRQNLDEDVRHCLGTVHTISRSGRAVSTSAGVLRNSKAAILLACVDMLESR